MLAYFSNIIADPSNPGKLKRFDLSSCRLNDTGLLYLINALQSNKNISHVRLTDNFFSESIEAILLETINKNTSLVDIALQGNRLSHSCLTKYDIFAKPECSSFAQDKESDCTQPSNDRGA